MKKQYLVTLKDGCFSYTVNNRKFLPNRAKVVSEDEVKAFIDSGAFNVAPYQGKQKTLANKSTATRKKGKVNGPITARALTNLEERGPLAEESAEGLNKRESEVVQAEKISKPKGTITKQMLNK